MSVRHFVCSTFCLLDILSVDILSVDILSAHRDAQCMCTISGVICVGIKGDREEQGRGRRGSFEAVSFSFLASCFQNFPFWKFDFLNLKKKMLKFDIPGGGN